MSILQKLRTIRTMIRAAFNWDVIEYTTVKEVQCNKLTGAYRWRFVNLNGDEDQDGPWIEGAPVSMVNRALVEDGTTLDDIAQMIAPPVSAVVRLDYGTDDLKGYALRMPDGTVRIWRDGEAPPADLVLIAAP